MVILFGAAGSGKSKQGRLLAEKFGWKWLSVGQLLRERAEADEKLSETLSRGDLVDDGLVVKMMHEEMRKALRAGKGAVLDGYPRDVRQAEWLVAHGDIRAVQIAVILVVPQDELRRRLKLRGRKDDTEETIRHRRKLFDETINKMTVVLERAGVKVLEVDGMGTIEAVLERLIGVLEENGVLKRGAE